ncbi:Hsp20/alpha crystallin family protein [Halobacterium sp. CBA1126]|uniref:Hsp20/alpha crystallin family protein n=1 Tax=Halobacterium TaxID=2239 RepID=UPI0012FB3ECA|nr:Hsp20/alpha crystallin family protein [Halobacterium sp. CBA1126]MUV61608.1 Hsp20 family protein [Halobacterium sp. CBA1126]
MTRRQSWPAAATNGAFADSSTPTDQSTVGSGAAPQAAGGVDRSAVPSRAEGAAQPPSAAAVPLVDVVESPDELVVRVDVPGFQKDQIEIQADANRLYVSADRSRADDDRDSDERALLTERPLRVERVVPLPMQIHPDQVTATHDDGVCEIVVPKDETERRHEVGFQ